MNLQLIMFVIILVQGNWLGTYLSAPGDWPGTGTTPAATAGRYWQGRAPGERSRCSASSAGWGPLLPRLSRWPSEKKKFIQQNTGNTTQQLYLCHTLNQATNRLLICLNKFI